jgi:hypothetical protein
MALQTDFMVSIAIAEARTLAVNSAMLAGMGSRRLFPAFALHSNKIRSGVERSSRWFKQHCGH